MFQTRVILYHNNPASARLRFLRFPYDSVFAFKPLPRLASLLEDHEIEADLLVHPAMIMKEVEKEFGLEEKSIEAEGEYQLSVDIAGGPVSILLGRFTGIDPPFSLAEKLDAEFIDLTQARSLPEVELLCLRKAYELVLGD